MSLGRRMELLKWAASAGAFIIEDDYDSEYRFEGRPIPALMSLDRGSNVIMVGSFSKLLFPALRIGYIVAPPAVLRSAGAIRSLFDIQGDLATEAAVAALIEDGELQRHVARVRRV